MKRLLPLLLFLFSCSPSFAEELPILWLEAGKETEFRLYEPLLHATHWTLRFEHRVLASGQVHNHLPDAQTLLRSVTIKVKTPPLDPGKTLRAKLFDGDVPTYNVVLAASDPFPDRKAWFDAHPIAIYDPEKGSVEALEQNEIPFKRLRSFADIEAVEDAVIVIGEGVNFETEKGLSELLFQKSIQGVSILVVAPAGDVPIDFHPNIHSFLLTGDRKYLFSTASRFLGVGTWTLQAQSHRMVLSLSNNEIIGGFEPSLLDVQFKARGGHLDHKALGRIIVESTPLFTAWNQSFTSAIFTDMQIERKYYFKSLIETLSK